MSMTDKTESNFAKHPKVLPTTYSYHMFLDFAEQRVLVCIQGVQISNTHTVIVRTYVLVAAIIRV